MTPEATEFQKFLSHSGVALNYPLAGLARLQLARAYAMEGYIVKARASYQEFHTIWKEADRNGFVLQRLFEPLPSFYNNGLVNLCARCRFPETLV